MNIAEQTHRATYSATDTPTSIDLQLALATQRARKAIAQIAKIELSAYHPLAVAVKVDSFTARLNRMNYAAVKKGAVTYPYGRLHALTGALNIIR